MKLTLKHASRCSGHIQGWIVSDGNTINNWFEMSWQSALEAVKRWIATGSPVKVK